VNLTNANSFVHSVENSLRSRLRAHPDFPASAALQRLDGFACHQVAPGLHFERNSRVQRFDRRRELEGPSGGQRENVVGKPNVVGSEAFFQLPKFTGN
jgi:hypothetical protein